MKPLLIIFNGESNSGGFASNSDAAPAELAVRPAIQLLNPITLLFESLDIGTNNILDHAGLTLGTHGWELGLAQQTEKNRFGKQPVYIMKTGQGGSTIDQWVGTDQTYWNKFLDRANAAKALLPNFVPIVWYTQGINDAIGFTNIEIWKTKTKQHFSRIREVFPGVNILFCQPPTESYRYSEWLPAIDEIVADNMRNYMISSQNASVNHLVNDTNHWSYSGMKSMASRLVSKTVSLVVSGKRSVLLPDLQQERLEVFA